jgi:hypothetical protein
MATRERRTGRQIPAGEDPLPGYLPAAIGTAAASLDAILHIADPLTVARSPSHIAAIAVGARAPRDSIRRDRNNMVVCFIVGEDAMRVHLLVGLAVLPATVTAAEHNYFSRTYLADESAVYLSLLSNQPSKDAGYDFDVLIGLTRVSREGTVLFHDTGRHGAHVRCGLQPAVSVGGMDYAVGFRVGAAGSQRWTDDLWKSVCDRPAT